MDRRLVLASRNAHKVVEVRRILAPVLDELGVELVGLDDYPDVPDVPETGATFEDNALLKARAIAAATGLTSVADDSGLAVAALNGMPGVLSARWAGRHGDDEANLRLVLDQLSDVPDERRQAAFVCAVAIADVAGREEVVRGEVTGSVIRSPRGSGGFGYDPIFVPAGHDRTTAELSPADKDALSHRGVALRALAQRLPEWVSAPPTTG